MAGPNPTIHIFLGQAAEGKEYMVGPARRAGCLRQALGVVASAGWEEHYDIWMIVITDYRREGRPPHGSSFLLYTHRSWGLLRLVDGAQNGAVEGAAAVVSAIAIAV